MKNDHVEIAVVGSGLAKAFALAHIANIPGVSAILDIHHEHEKHLQRVAKGFDQENDLQRLLPREPIDIKQISLTHFHSKKKNLQHKKSKYIP